jgi:outer membrane lipoprotein LolB
LRPRLRTRLGLALATAALLSACATPPRATDQAPPLEGRLAVRVAGQPERDLSASFELAGSAERGTLLLSGPLGAAAASASWSPEGAQLRSGNGDERFTSLDSLAERALGEAFPIAALFDWLRGRPWPGATSQARDDGIPGFVQLGWQVDLGRLAEGWIEARRTQAPVVTVRVKLTPAS